MPHRFRLHRRAPEPQVGSARGRSRKIVIGLLTVLGALGCIVAWRIHVWGRPIPAAYRHVAVTLGAAGVGRNFHYVRTERGRDGAPRITASDTDGDGTVDRVLTEGRRDGAFQRPGASDPDARRLVLCLDGVPYGEVAALWEEGYFREFFRPVPLIAPFPSDSEVAVTAAFHAGVVPGYEHRYYDRQANRMQGGMRTTLTGSDIPYLRLLDYDMSGLFKGIAYVLPEKSYRADLDRLRRRFLVSRDKIFLARLASSDSLYHIVPREAMRRLLRDVDALVRALYFDARGTLRVTVFSDHGNSLTPSRPISLEGPLETRGWRLRERLEDRRDVVVPSYGLIGFAAVYSRPEARDELARLLATVEGVDLVVYADTGHVVLEAADGRARFAWKEDGSAFRYEPLVGDPLMLGQILTRLAWEGKVDGEGWVKDADLFEATAWHHYPDPGYRLWQWATDHVRNRADLALSLQPGYFHGSGFFRQVVDVLSTHGSLDWAQSAGFAMSTDGPLPAPVRSHELLGASLRSGR